MILAIDLGTSVTKAALWDHDGMAGLGRVPLETQRPAPGWAEQDPMDWWESVVAATRLAVDARTLGGVEKRVEVIALGGARQSFVLADGEGAPLGPGVLWSDTRGAAEAPQLVAALGGADTAHALTGVPLDAGALAAKLAWLAHREPDRLARARWVLAPRDFVAFHLTGMVATDLTMASRGGLHDLDGNVIDALAGPAASRLPPVLPSTDVVGPLLDEPARLLGLRPGLPVVVGAGDRACEVHGSGAHPGRPMVSWGTTANVAVPLDRRPESVPPALALTRSASGGWLLEGGLSGAGSLLAWLSQLTGQSVDQLVGEAARSPMGARGAVAAPWFDGARAPWWNSSARGGFVGLGISHDAGDLARAAIEAVAADVQRCLTAAQRGGAATAGECEWDGLALAGRGSTSSLWSEVLAGMTGLPLVARRSGEAALAGVARLGAEATGQPFDLGHADPVEPTVTPEPSTVAAYRKWLARVDRVAPVLLDLELGDEARGPDRE